MWGKINPLVYTRTSCILSGFIVPERGTTLSSSSYVGSGPASIVHPKKYLEFQAPQKIFEVLPNPQNTTHSVPGLQEKTLKCIEMTRCQFKECPGIGLYTPFLCILYDTLALARTYVCTLAKLPTIRK